MQPTNMLSRGPAVDPPTVAPVTAAATAISPSVATSSGTASPTLVTTYEITHTFSIDDVMGGFDGSNFGPNGAVEDKTIICGAPGSTIGDLALLQKLVRTALSCILLTTSLGSML
mmetsp:Transcript_13591/g.24610  ORF Transcript_13591/g.24610 Transcript_13591/m.24610 type:complete len:115 (+) Transcript_13591:1598-1942(+)